MVETIKAGGIYMNNNDKNLKTPKNRKDDHFVKYGDKMIYVAQEDEIVPNCESQPCSFSINDEDDINK